MSVRRKRIYEFGAYRLDESERTLSRDGQALPLPAKAFDTLLLLVGNRGHLLEKDELMRRLWPDTFVEEANLTNNISLLRKALASGAAESAYIETVPRRGYRFIGGVRELGDEEGELVVERHTLASLSIEEEHEVEDKKVRATEEIFRLPVTKARAATADDATQTAAMHAAEAIRPAPARRTSRRVKLIVLMVLVIIAAIALTLLLKVKPDLLPLKVMPFTSLIGNESQPAFSPDGTRIAFVWGGEKSDNADIYVKLLDAGSPMRLTSDPANDFGPVWSPDGNYIAFLRRSTERVAVYLIPSLGGPERKLSEFEFVLPSSQMGPSKLDWSPDGKFLAVAERTDANQFAIFLLSIETGEARRLTTPPPEYIGDMHPAFSPDGRTLAFTRTRHVEVSEVYLMPVAGGEARPLTSDNQVARSPAWTADGREIVFISNRAGGNLSLWRVAVSGGEPVPLAGIADVVTSFAISRRGNRLAYAQEAFDPNIWRVAATQSPGQNYEPTKLIASTRIETNAQYSPDGKNIAFASDRSGSFEIWVCNSDGANPVQLTSFGEHTGTPRWSPDGKYIAFDSRPGGNADIFVIKATGGQPRRLTIEDAEDIVPSWSPDGRWVYFTSNRGGDWQVWKTPAEGGEAVQVTHQGGYGPQPSPDGRFIYYGKQRNSLGPLWIVPAEGGAEEIVAGFTKRTSWIGCAITARGFYFINPLEALHTSIEFFDFNKKKCATVARFDKRLVNAISVSPDGRWILYTQIDRRDTDIMLVENFR